MDDDDEKSISGITLDNGEECVYVFKAYHGRRRGDDDDRRDLRRRRRNDRPIEYEVQVTSSNPDAKVVVQHGEMGETDFDEMEWDEDYTWYEDDGDDGHESWYWEEVEDNDVAVVVDILAVGHA